MDILVKLKNFLPQDTLDAVRNSDSSQRKVLTISLLKLRADIWVGSNFLGIEFYNRVDFVCFHAIAGNSRETEISGERHVDYCLVVAYGISMRKHNARLIFCDRSRILA